MSVYRPTRGGVAFFGKPPANPLEVVGVLYRGRPPLLPPKMGALIVGAGRVGYGFSCMAAQAPGNEGSLIMILPHGIVDWYQLCHSKNPGRLAEGVSFNPSGEKSVHVLPPRGVMEKLRSFARMIPLDPARWGPVFSWALRQVQDKKVKEAADYWLAAAQFQAITTRVGALETVVDNRYIQGLHPQGKYTLLHATKSMGSLQRGDGKPLFGHEIVQALLKAGGRGDLADRVVASAGYWVDTTIAQKRPVRLHFTSTGSEEAVKDAGLVIGGLDGFNPLVNITMGVGRDVVFSDQFGGVIKNILALVLGMEGVRMGEKVRTEDPDYVSLERRYEEIRGRFIGTFEALAAKAMGSEGIKTPKTSNSFAPAVIEDILTCTHLNWPAFFAKASELGLTGLRERQRGQALESAEVQSLRKGLLHFVKTARVEDFGTTNETYGIVFGLASLLAGGGFVSAPRELIDSAIPLPEGLRAMPHFIDRFEKMGIPNRLSVFIRALRPIWGQP